MRINNILAILILGFSTASFAVELQMPTLYGFLNKEVRWVDQEDSTRSPGFAITDVDGFESRIGLMGEIPWQEDYKFLYKMEVGMNSNTDSTSTTATEDRIRVRLAQGTLQTAKWGSFTFGQAWMPSALWLIKFDPLIATGLENWSLDTSYVGGSTAGLRGLGYSMKLFSDQLSYSTPVFHGFQYSVTHDQRAQQSDFKNGKQVSYEHLLTWDNGKDNTVNIRAMYSRGDEYYSFPGQHRELNTIAAMADWNKFGVQFSVGNEKNSPATVDYRREFLGFTYQVCEKTTLIATYGALSKGRFAGSEKQFAIGAKWMLTPKVRWTVLFGHYDVDGEGTNIINTDSDVTTGTGPLGLDADKNTANIVLTGLKLDF